MKAKVLPKRLNVRARPSRNGTKLDFLKRGTLVEILAENEGWLEIKFNGRSAFVHGDYLEMVDAPGPMKGKVTAGRLNVRDRPSTDSALIGSFSKGSVIDVLEEEGDWLEVAFNDQAAFVHSDFVELVEAGSAAVGTVDADVLNVRSAPQSRARILGRLNCSAEIKIISQIDDWLEIRFNDAPGFVHKDYVDIGDAAAEARKPIVVSREEKQENEEGDGALAPLAKLPVSGTNIEKKVARTWNHYGALLESLSGSFKIETASAIAVLCVESSGKGFEKSNDNRMIVRFENHKFWSYWGKNNAERFHRHFKYGKRDNGKLKVWLGHAWRATAADNWQSFHGNQDKEWQVLEFARSLDDTAALQSISMGAPQIMGFHHKRIGCETVQEMFDTFAADIRHHIYGLFNFFDKKMIAALQHRDFVTFAGYYNGSGQKTKYGEWILNHYDAFENITA